jgi:hypothetical protein
MLRILKRKLGLGGQKYPFTSFTFVVRSFGNTKDDMKGLRFVKVLFFWMGGHHFT